MSKSEAYEDEGPRVAIINHFNWRSNDGRLTIEVSRLTIKMDPLVKVIKEIYHMLGKLHLIPYHSTKVCY